MSRNLAGQMQLRLNTKQASRSLWTTLQPTWNQSSHSIKTKTRAVHTRPATHYSFKVEDRATKHSSPSQIKKMTRPEMTSRWGNKPKTQATDSSWAGKILRVTDWDYKRITRRSLKKLWCQALQATKISRPASKNRETLKLLQTLRH